MERPARRYFEFDSFRIDTEERILLRHGALIPLTPKVFDLLLLLVENNRHTVAKDDLMDRLWSNTVVEENSLNRNISLLRKALGNGSDASGGYIRTVPKRGYRFESDLHIVVEDEEELIVEKRTNYSVTLHQNSESDVEAATSWQVVPRVAAISAVALGVILLVAWAVTRSGNEVAAVAGENALGRAEASELYRRGRELWQNRSATGLHEATLLLERATEKDKGHAPAHAALADAYAFDARDWRKVEDAAAEAIRLDPNLGNPHASVGFIRFFWQWDPRGAEDNFKRARSLSPDYATAHQWYGVMLASVGDFNEAFAEMEKALALEPASVAINSDMCQMLYFVRRFYEAEAQCKKTLELDPNFFSAHSQLHQIYAAQGKRREAVEAYFARERLGMNVSSYPVDFEQLRAAFDRGGLNEFWRELIRLRSRPDGDCGGMLAWVYANLSEKKKAIACLQKSAEKREFGLVFIYADPVLRMLNDQPAYNDIASRLMSGQLALASGGQ